jgi:hypothetical protein
VFDTRYTTKPKPKLKRRKLKRKKLKLKEVEMIGGNEIPPTPADSQAFSPTKKNSSFLLGIIPIECQ